MRRRAHRLPPPFRHGPYGDEQMDASDKPVKDEYLSGRLGVNVRVFKRGAGHMAHGYADPDVPVAERGVDVSQPDLERIYQLLTPHARVQITPTMARSAYVLAHELGHLNARDHHNEDQANAWAAANFGRVLKRLGLGLRDRREVVRLARQQGLA